MPGRTLVPYARNIYETQRIHSNYWKLKAIDSLEVSDDEHSIMERRKIIDTLIDDKGIKESLLAKSMR